MYKQFSLKRTRPTKGIRYVLFAKIVLLSKALLQRSFTFDEKQKVSSITFFFFLINKELLVREEKK